MAGDGQQDRQNETVGHGRLRCHFISNTHWDREWKYSSERTRFGLVQMLDLLLDIFRQYPEYKHFHLDSQTIPVLDYLEIRPEREGELRDLVSSGRLAIGPWFCLPDEFCVSGDSLVRNLLLGHRIARRFGRVTKTGYTPFSWGQISQMPQIYRGFGIEMMMFYRGINSRVAPHSEFVWEGPDGTRILASRLSAKPRYNAWYLLQRPAYWGVPLASVHDFEQRWADGSGLFRLADKAHAWLDWQLLHPRHDYDPSVMPDAACQALREQDGDWRTAHRLWSCGHDGSFPDARELRLMADAQQAIKDQADVFHSTFEAFQAGVQAGQHADWPVVRGEMRHTYTAGSTSALLGWILSARTYLKQDNHRTERLLTTLAEPLAAFARLWGASYPRAFLDRAYQLLLTNHTHDGIGGVGRDVVHADMLGRSRQAREIGTCVMEHALAALAGSVDVSNMDPHDVALLVYNAMPQVRSDVLALELDTPAEWNTADFEIVDEMGRPVAYQRIGTPLRCESGVHNPHDVQLYFVGQRHQLRVEVRDLPACGYRVYQVRPRSRLKPTQPATLCTGPQTMSNEHLTVTINANGTLDVLHHSTGRRYTQLGYLRDSGATGTAWEHQPPAHERVFTTLNEQARVARICDGALECRFRIELDWDLPVGLVDDGRRRSDQLVTVPVVHEVTLRRGIPWVEIVTTVENTVRDHYLRVSFPSRLAAGAIAAGAPFDVVSRPIATPDYSQFDDVPQTEQPWQGFVSVADGEAGLALLGDGLRAYEAHDDPDRTVSLTLLRAFALRFYVPDRVDDPELARSAQCPGAQSFRYGILPHAGAWQTAGLWSAAEMFNTPLVAAQFAPTQYGGRPRVGSFCEVQPDSLHVSAVKESESGAGVVVRLFNPTGDAVPARVRLGGGHGGPSPVTSPLAHSIGRGVLPADVGPRWRGIRRVTLEETPMDELAVDENGWVSVPVERKQIVTLEFLR